MTLVDQKDRFMRLGLKAQDQCRHTLETLAVMKNPPVFARQANIANGPQQVNNGHAPEPRATVTLLPPDTAGQPAGTLLEAGSPPERGSAPLALPAALPVTIETSRSDRHARLPARPRAQRTIEHCR